MRPGFGMTIYVCMLRGINVGGQNKVSMSALRALFDSLEYRDVATYVQSGNVVFTRHAADENILAGAIEARIASEHGLTVPCVLRSGRELEQIIAVNPLLSGGRDMAKLHVTFLAKEAQAALVDAVGEFRSPPDEFVIAGREVYLYCPAGYGVTKLNNTFW